MKTRDELSAEFQRLMDEDRLEEASALLDLIPPLSDEEWRRRLDEAPLDDEPLSPKELQRIREFEEFLERAGLKTG